MAPDAPKGNTHKQYFREISVDLYSPRGELKTVPFEHTTTKSIYLKRALYRKVLGRKLFYMTFWESKFKEKLPGSQFSKHSKITTMLA